MTGQHVCSALALGCSLLAGITDVRRRIIPNALTLSSACVGLLLHCIFGGWAGLLSSLTAGLVAGAIFFALYVAGGMGAGDVKLIAAVGFLNGLPSMPLLLLVTVVSGGIIGLGMAVRRGLLLQTLQNVVSLVTHHAHQGARPHADLNLSNQNTLRIPYAVPIAIGCIAAACAAYRTAAV